MSVKIDANFISALLVITEIFARRWARGEINWEDVEAVRKAEQERSADLKDQLLTMMKQ